MGAEALHLLMGRVFERESGRQWNAYVQISTICPVFSLALIYVGNRQNNELFTHLNTLGCFCGHKQNEPKPVKKLTFNHDGL